MFTSNAEESGLVMVPGWVPHRDLVHISTQSETRAQNEHVRWAIRCLILGF